MKTRTNYFITKPRNDGFENIDPLYSLYLFCFSRRDLREPKYDGIKRDLREPKYDGINDLLEYRWY